MDEVGPSLRGVKRKADEVPLPVTAPRRIKVSYLHQSINIMAFF